MVAGHRDVVCEYLRELASFKSANSAQAAFHPDIICILARDFASLAIDAPGCVDKKRQLPFRHRFS
jgi:hypothetical protein